MSSSNFAKRARNIMRSDAGINGDVQRIEQMTRMLFLEAYDEKENDWELDDDNYKLVIPEEYRWRNWARDDGGGDALTDDDSLSFINNTLFARLKDIEITPSTPIREAIAKTTFENTNQYMKDGVQLRQVLNVTDGLNLGDYEESHAFGKVYETILEETQSADSSGELCTPRALTEFMAETVNPWIGEKMADLACDTGGFITSWLGELDKKVKTTESRREYDQSALGIEKKQFSCILCVTNLLLHGIDTPLVSHGNSLTKDVLNYTGEDKFDVVLVSSPYGDNEESDVKSHSPSDIRSSETADLFMVPAMYRLKKNGHTAAIVPDGFLPDADSTKIATKTKLFRDFNLHTITCLPGSIFAPYISIAIDTLFFDNAYADGALEGFSTKDTWFYRLDMPEGYKHFSKTKSTGSVHYDPIREWWNGRKGMIIANDDEKAHCYPVQELIDTGCNFDLCKLPKKDEEILPPIELLANYFKKRRILDYEIDKILVEIQRILGIDVNMEEL